MKSAPPLPACPRGSRDYRVGLVLVLTVSLVLRLVLVMRGGQYFFPDEYRYAEPLSALNNWSHGYIRPGLFEAIGRADHLGFKIIMLLPAWLQLHLGGDIRIPAAFLALFSTANVLWIWFIARSAGAEAREAFWCTAAMAASNTMFYWARHLVPYDLALFFELACAHLAFRPASSIRASCYCGFWGMVAFVTYNGYWSSVACILVAHVLLALPRWKVALQRAVFSFLGFALSFSALMFAIYLAGYNLLPKYREFAKTITEGDFPEGHIVFFDYLWQAERITSFLWAAALVLSGWLVARARPSDRRRGAAWAAIIVALAAILIGGSNWLHQFVVYGRLVRQVAPFASLLLGWTAGQLLGTSRRAEGLALAALVACAAISMAKPLTMQYPITFQQEAQRAIAAYRAAHAAEGARVAPDKFRVLYAVYLWPLPDEPPLPPGSVILLSSPHPGAWLPYLYEGFNHQQRSAILAADVTMRAAWIKN